MTAVHCLSSVVQLSPRLHSEKAQFSLKVHFSLPQTLRCVISRELQKRVSLISILSLMGSSGALAGRLGSLAPGPECASHVRVMADGCPLVRSLSPPHQNAPESRGPHPPGLLGTRPHSGR